jgi:hypothetical protein
MTRWSPFLVFVGFLLVGVIALFPPISDRYSFTLQTESPRAPYYTYPILERGCLFLGAKVRYEKSPVSKTYYRLETTINDPQMKLEILAALSVVGLGLALRLAADKPGSGT